MFHFFAITINFCKTGQLAMIYTICIKLIYHDANYQSEKCLGAGYRF